MSSGGDLLERFRRLRASVLEKTPPASDPKLMAYLANVRERAYRITDEDVAALLASGHSEDALFEHTVGAALNASIERLSAGLEALAAATNDEET